MISLNKFMEEVKNKLKRLEDKKYVKDNLSLNGSICFAAIKGHKYSFAQNNWGDQCNVYIHQN